MSERSLIDCYPMKGLRVSISSKLSPMSPTDQGYLPRLNASQRAWLICRADTSFNMMANCAFDLLETLASIYGYEVRTVIRGSNVSKELADPILELLLLVSFFAPTSSLCCILCRDVKEQTQVGSRKAFFRMTAPSEVKAGIVLRRRIDTSRIVIPINDNSGASIDVCFYRCSVHR